MKTESKIKTKMSEIWIDEEGFLILKILDDAEVDLKEVKTCFEAYTKLGIGPHNKIIELIDARGNVSLSPEAKAYAAQIGKDYFIASAMVNDSLSAKLVVNFFNAFFKQTVPFKLFATEESAKQWLRTFK